MANPSETMARRGPGKGSTRYWEVFEHPADAGVRGWGASLEEALSNAARALFDLVCNTNEVRPEEKIRIDVRSVDREMLLIDLLNELIAEMDLGDLLFSNLEDADIGRPEGHWRFTAFAIGERLCMDRHEIRIEAKAATCSQLRVERVDDAIDPDHTWVAQCIIDV